MSHELTPSSSRAVNVADSHEKRKRGKQNRQRPFKDIGNRVCSHIKFGNQFIIIYKVVDDFLCSSEYFKRKGGKKKKKKLGHDLLKRGKRI